MNFLSTFVFLTTLRAISGLIIARSSRILTFFNPKNENIGPKQDKGCLKCQKSRETAYHGSEITKKMSQKCFKLPKFADLKITTPIMRGQQSWKHRLKPVMAP